MNPIDLGRRRSPWHLAHLAAFVGVTGVLFVACDDGGADDLDASCETAADCKLASNCCAGCLAINVAEQLEPCDATCIVAPCEGEFGDAELSATCNQGKCEVVAEPGPSVCQVDADCHVVGDCCMGCVAKHVDDSLPECTGACVADPCDTEYPAGVPGARCDQGTCVIEDTSCDAPTDCKVVSDCCLGCVALPVGAVTPPCDAQCIVDPCEGEHGPDAVVSATCENEACEIVVAQPGG